MNHDYQERALAGTPDPSADSHAGYSPFMIDGEDYGSCFIFWFTEPEQDELRNQAFDAGFTSDGWYWWAAWPSCLPDSDPTGPFLTSRDAYENAVGD